MVETYMMKWWSYEKNDNSSHRDIKKVIENQNKEYIATITKYMIFLLFFKDKKKRTKISNLNSFKILSFIKAWTEFLNFITLKDIIMFHHLQQV